MKFIIDGISVQSAEELQSCDESQVSSELQSFVNKLILINTLCAQCFVRFSPRLNILADTINIQEDIWYAPMAEMNFGPPQMSITSGPRLTYGTIISSAQLFTQAQWQSTSSMHSPETQNSSGKNDKMDSAKKEWERATPENLRRIHAKDLRKILHTSSSHLGPSIVASASSSKNIDFSNYITGQDLTVPLLSSPRLVKRPFDPLICENIILSRATALVPLPARPHRNKGSSPGVQDSQSASPRRNSNDITINSNVDPWFASMEENNTRLALETNLTLIICQAFEGVRSSRLTVRDQQLIGRETATELSIFFDFLEHSGFVKDWNVQATLVDTDVRKKKIVTATEEFCKKPHARLKNNTTIKKIPISLLQDEPSTSNRTDIKEIRSQNDIISSGCFSVKVDEHKFLPLLGKLLKTIVDSLDSAQFG